MNDAIRKSDFNNCGQLSLEKGFHSTRVVWKSTRESTPLLLDATSDDPNPGAMGMQDRLDKERNLDDIGPEIENRIPNRPMHQSIQPSTRFWVRSNQPLNLRSVLGPKGLDNPRLRLRTGKNVARNIIGRNRPQSRIPQVAQNGALSLGNAPGDGPRTQEIAHSCRICHNVR